MYKVAGVPIHSSPAHLWDGDLQLPGTLELLEQQVVFRLSNFKDSHLNLVIPLAEIGTVEEYLVFDLARNGLRICSKGGRCDLFVMENSQVFKLALKRQIAQYVAGGK